MIQRVCLVCRKAIAVTEFDECAICAEEEARFVEHIENAPIEVIEAELRAEGINPDKIVEDIVNHVEAKRDIYRKCGIEYPMMNAFLKHLGRGE